MTLEQLARPEKYSELPDLWESDAPPGERIKEYVKREWNHQPHEGETPPSINAEVLAFSQKAIDAIDSAEPLVTKNRDEYQRLKNDVHCIAEMSRNYAAKVNAEFKEGLLQVRLTKSEAARPKQIEVKVS